MRRYLEGRNEPWSGFQVVLEVTRSQERQITSLEEDPLKEASQQTSWSFDPYL